MDNFLFEIKQYFMVIDIRDDIVMARTAVMYLTNISMLWWWCRSDDVKREANPIVTWEVFQKKFRQQFYLEYAKDEARAKLRHCLKGAKFICTRIFGIVVEIFDMTRKMLLKSWAKMELQWRGVQEPSKAMVMEKDLTEFKPRSNSIWPKNKDKVGKKEKKYSNTKYFKLKSKDNKGDEQSKKTD